MRCKTEQARLGRTVESSSGTGIWYHVPGTRSSHPIQHCVRNPDMLRIKDSHENVVRWDGEDSDLQPRFTHVPFCHNQALDLHPRDSLNP